MSTTISRATLMLTLGRPDSSCLVIAPKPKRLVFDYDAWYRDLGLKVNMEGLFPGAAMLYDWPVALEFRSSLPDTAPAWLLPRSHCQ